MNAHLSSNNNTTAAAKKDKKLCYELELFEQNLEDLLQTESNPPSSTLLSSTSTSHEPKKEDDCQENETSDNEETSGEACYESLPDDIVNSDLSEWNCIFSEPNTITNLTLCSNNSISSSDIATTTTTTTAITSPQNVNGAGGNRKKRFKANDNPTPDLTAQSVPQLQPPPPPQPVPTSSQLITNTKNLKRFYYKPFLVYKCQICSRKMSSFDVEHWLQHDREAHQKIFTNNFKSLTQGFAYQQVTCVKAPMTTTTSSSSSESTPNVPITANHQLVKQFESFTEFLSNFKQISSTPGGGGGGGNAESIKLIPCLICGTELRFTLIDMLKHYQCEHEFNIMLNLKPRVTLDDLEILHTLYINNYVLVCQGVHLRRRCFIRVPPLLTVTSTG